MANHPPTPPPEHGSGADDGSPSDTPASPSSFAVTLRRDTARGVRTGLETFWVLAKTMIPAYAAALVLNELGVIDALARVSEPLMDLLGLPGGAALPLLLAFFLNPYAAVGAMQALDLSASQISVLAVTILISHNLVVEGAVLRRAGMSAAGFTTLRVVAGLTAGMAANSLMHLG